MFDTINLWNIKLTETNGGLINKSDVHNFEENKKYLLETNKEEYNIIEKITYEIFKFHSTNLNLNDNEIFIEFCIETFKKKKNNDRI
jgi:hypothetical protein